MNVNRCGWLNEWDWSFAHCVDWWTVVGALGVVVDYKQPQKRRNEAGERRIVAAGVDEGD